MTCYFCDDPGYTGPKEAPMWRLEDHAGTGGVARLRESAVRFACNRHADVFAKTFARAIRVGESTVARAIDMREEASHVDHPAQ